MSEILKMPFPVATPSCNRIFGRKISRLESQWLAKQTHKMPSPPAYTLGSILICFAVLIFLYMHRDYTKM